MKEIKIKLTIGDDEILNNKKALAEAKRGYFEDDMIYDKMKEEVSYMIKNLEEDEEFYSKDIYEISLDEAKELLKKIKTAIKQKYDCNKFLKENNITLNLSCYGISTLFNVLKNNGKLEYVLDDCLDIDNFCCILKLTIDGKSTYKRMYSYGDEVGRCFDPASIYSYWEEARNWDNQETLAKRFEELTKEKK